MIVCYTTCWACKFNEHSSKWHTWADADDVEHAEQTKQADPRTQQCGCYCQQEVAA